MPPAFRGDQFYRSNFSPSPITVTIGGAQYEAPTAEHAFQLSKTADPTGQLWVLRSLTPNEAKIRGRDVPIIPVWNDIRIAIMCLCLAHKFKIPHLRQTLQASTDVITETNPWHDNFWGDCDCQNRGGKHPECLTAGENWLGHLLTIERSDIILAALIGQGQGEAP